MALGVSSRRSARRTSTTPKLQNRPNRRPRHACTRVCYSHPQPHASSLLHAPPTTHFPPSQVQCLLFPYRVQVPSLSYGLPDSLQQGCPALQLESWDMQHAPAGPGGLGGVGDGGVGDGDGEGEAPFCTVKLYRASVPSVPKKSLLSDLKSSENVCVVKPLLCAVKSACTSGPTGSTRGRRGTQTPSRGSVEAAKIAIGASHVAAAPRATPARWLKAHHQRMCPFTASTLFNQSRPTRPHQLPQWPLCPPLSSPARTAHDRQIP